ncbi:hypothetical protein ACI2K4_21925 [Micromonospora sp. NPDC050397]|uniref:hypothetical protein n=1 Tax=Micromonospora sp. NPDC050397 TaxID=3364279 RepID=UPI00384B1385
MAYDDEDFDLEEWRADPVIRAIAAVLFPEPTTPVPPPRKPAEEIRADAEQRMQVLAEQGIVTPDVRVRDECAIQREDHALVDNRLGRARRHLPQGRTRLLADQCRRPPS